MYKNGPLNLGITYENAKESCTLGAATTNYWGGAVSAASCTTALESTSTFNALLAQYDFGFAKVNYIHSSKKAEAVATNVQTDTKFNQINVKVPLNAQTELRLTTNTSKATNGTVSDWKGNFVNVNYDLSKRTKLYASTGTQKDTTAADAVTVKEKRTAVGIVHTF
jgi:predicted porin